MTPKWINDFMESVAVRLLRKRQPHRMTAEEVATYYGVPYVRVVAAMETYLSEREEYYRRVLQSIVSHEKDCRHNCQGSRYMAENALGKFG